MITMGILYNIALTLVLIGAVNWGLVSLFKFDLVAAILAGSGNFGNISTISRIIYGLVGLSALFVIIQYLFYMFLYNINNKWLSIGYPFIIKLLLYKELN